MRQRDWKKHFDKNFDGLFSKEELKRLNKIRERRETDTKKNTPLYLYKFKKTK